MEKTGLRKTLRFTPAPAPGVPGLIQKPIMSENHAMLPICEVQTLAPMYITSMPSATVEVDITIIFPQLSKPRPRDVR